MRIAVLLAGGWIASRALLAAEAPLDADSAAARALRDNPELRAARQLVTEAGARARGAGRLTNPELETEIGAGPDGEGRVAVGLTQRFPLTARLRWERRLSALAVEAARMEIRERERQLAAATRRAFFALAADREAIALASRQRDAAQTFARSLERGAAEGLAAPLESGEAALAVETLAAALDARRAEEAGSAAQLATLLGLPADAPLRLRDSPALPAAPPANRSPGFLPALRLAELAVQSGAADVSLAEAARWDDVGVGFFAEGERLRDEPGGIEPEALVGLRFNVPLPLWQNGTAAVAEKRAAATRQREQLAALRLAALNQALAAHRAMTARHRAATLATARLVPAARRQLAAAEAAHGRAEIDAAAVFRARERLAAAESTALEARRDFHLAHAEWLAALGEPATAP